MAEDIRKKNNTKRKENNTKRKKKKIFIVVFFSISLYLLIGSIPIMFGGINKTILPEVGILYNKTEGKAVAIKNETIYYSEGNGEINYLVNEGVRVPVGIEITNISLLKDTSKLKQELIEVEQWIETLSKKARDPKNQGDGDIDNQTRELIKEIQKEINLGNLKDVHRYKEELQIIDSSISDTTLLGQSLESLEKQRDLIKKQISSNNLRYYSNTAGFVSYDIDGYENIFIAKDFQNYTYDNLNIEEHIENKVTDEKKDNKEISVGSPLFKIIDNFEWYFAIKVENKSSIEQYSIGQDILIELDTGNELDGKIIEINISNDNAVLIVKFTTFLHENYNIRYSKANIINSKKEGYKLPFEVVVEKDGKKGVYIKEINGIVKFRPISIFGEDDKYIYINKGDNNGYVKIDGDDNPVKTVTLYDEIFINPTSVEEGEILR